MTENRLRDQLHDQIHDQLHDQLLAAVRAGNAEGVRALVQQGADPDALTEDGLPVLCAAVAAYDAPVAEALVEGGADPDRVLPDGTTPLWRAVDGGSPAVFSAVLGKEPRLRLPEADRERLLALARGWYETGAAEELRRRTGAPGPATTVRVQDDEYDTIDQVSLGGLVVRAGHGGILTALEWAFRILPPVDELIDRAMGHPHAERDANWSTVCWNLSQRLGDRTWSAVVAHRHHPEPAHRRFVLDYLWTRQLVRYGNNHAYYERKAGELLAEWAVEETDDAVLARLLDVFAGYGHPSEEAVGLRHAAHPDPRVRREVPYALCTDYLPDSPAARDALRALIRDPDAEVRLNACTACARDDGLRADITPALILLLEEPDAGIRSAAAAELNRSSDPAPAALDALATLLDDPEQLIRLEAAYGLARCDDPRTEDAIEKVGPLDPVAFEHDHRVDALWRWRWRKEDPAVGR